MKLHHPDIWKILPVFAVVVVVVVCVDIDNMSRFLLPKSRTNTAFCDCAEKARSYSRNFAGNSERQDPSESFPKG